MSGNKATKTLLHTIPSKPYILTRSKSSRNHSLGENDFLFTSLFPFHPPYLGVNTTLAPSKFTQVKVNFSRHTSVASALAIPAKA